jgi:hypothetical protein
MEYLKLGTPKKHFEYLEFGVLKVGDSEEVLRVLGEWST